MKYLNVIVTTFFLGLFLSFVGCENPDSPEPSTTDEFKVITQNSYQTYKTGDVMEIKWSYSKDWSYQKTRIKLRTSPISMFKDISPADPLRYPTSTYNHTIKASETGDSCQIMVCDYDENEKTYSNYFKISN